MPRKSSLHPSKSVHPPVPSDAEKSRRKAVVCRPHFPGDDIFQLLLPHRAERSRPSPLLSHERLTNLFGIKVGRPDVSENPGRFYAKHTPKPGKRRSPAVLCRAGYDAIIHCDSDTKGTETKNPVIKDWTRENKKNGRVTIG